MAPKILVVLTNVDKIATSGQTIGWFLVSSLFWSTSTSLIYIGLFSNKSGVFHG